MGVPGGNSAPVIIKRKKVVKAAAHHGGAWKVAYADFVTAMMAFFLLMWLLSATSEKQRKGIADYFSPTIPISRVSGGGDDDFGGDSVFSEERLAQNGVGASNMRPTEGRQARGENGLEVTGVETLGADTETGVEIPETLKEVEELLLGRAGESTVSQDLKKHIRTRITDEGLIIELFDFEGARLFAADTASPQPVLVELATLIADVSTLVKNRISVEGHTRARPIVLADRPVWILSTERANTMRALLETGGLGGDRMARVTGHADRKPVVQNPMALRNNRLEIILLRRKMTGN